MAMTSIPCGGGVSIVRTIPVQQPKFRFNDELGRSQVDRRFVRNFDRIFNAASIGDLSACQKIVKKGFRDFNAYSIGKSFDNITILQIAETNRHHHIVDFFNSQRNPETKEIYSEVDLKELNTEIDKLLLNGSPSISEKSGDDDDFSPEEFNDEMSQRLTLLNIAASSDEESEDTPPPKRTTTIPRRSSASELYKSLLSFPTKTESTNS